MENPSATHITTPAPTNSVELYSAMLKDHPTYELHFQSTSGRCIVQAITEPLPFFEHDRVTGYRYGLANARTPMTTDQGDEVIEWLNDMNKDDFTDEDEQDLMERLYEAKDKLIEVIDVLEEVVEITGDRHLQAYLVDHLKIRAGNDHGFLSNDPTMDDAIKSLEEYLQ